MTTTHLVPGLVFGASASIFSWIVSMMLSPLLRTTAYYSRLSSLDFAPRAPLSRRLGLHHFKWVVRNTPFKFLNPAIRVRGTGTDLALIRDEMTKAEINHLIGFALVILAALYMGIAVGPVFGVAMMVGNTLLNLYPSLLQQENKRRIDRVVHRRDAAARPSPARPGSGSPHAGPPSPDSATPSPG
jgi:hypothetical protein